VDKSSVCAATDRGTVENVIHFRTTSSPEEVGMMTAETMRKNAEHCRALAEGATSEPVRTRYLRTAAAWDDLANSQDWLDGALRSSLALQPRLHTAA
jgi:hypothetical protein